MSFQMLKSECEQDQVTPKNNDVIWKEEKPHKKNATPSIIRRGLCMVRNEGIKSLKRNLFCNSFLPGDNLKTVIDRKKAIAKGIAKHASESIVKYGAEVATACDPLEAAITLGGKVGVGLSLSRFSASQCAGLVGVIVSSIMPQVLIFFKILSIAFLSGISAPFAEEDK